MLILSRKLGEDIYIGEQVRLVVLENPRSGEVQLGFEGPRDISILRGELLTRRNVSRPAGNAPPPPEVRSPQSPPAPSYPKRPLNTPYPQNQWQLPTPLSPFRIGRR